MYGLGIILVLLVGFLTAPYLVSPVYDFSEPKPFSGEGYYNPYEHIDDAWRLSNFHAHSRSWSGFTDGKNTHIDSILSIYQELGYTHIGISNYQKITAVHSADIASIPVYEHGFNVKKRHHLSLGTDKVSWLDFFLFQTIHHKQYVLNRLRSTSDFLTINHPSFAQGFEASDFSYLSNYDAIEVLNHYRTSLPHWDSALSSGYYAVLLANDDMHKLDRMDEVSVNFTVINTASLARYDILQALKAGRHYGVKVHLTPKENYQIKKERNAHLIHPKVIKMQGDTLFVEMDSVVRAIRFVGQGGEPKDSMLLTDRAYYIFDTTDTYIRMEVQDMDSNLYLFNPIVRTNDCAIVNACRASLNPIQTLLKRTLILLLILTVVLLVLFFYGKRHRQYGQRIKTFFLQPYRRPFAILLFVSILLRILIASNIELTNDEVYYRLYALYPDFSHFDHPPMVGWLIQATTWNLLFDSEFFIRLGAILLGSVNLVLAFRIGKRIGDAKTGFIAAFLCSISPYVSLIAGTFILPDTTLLFFWMCTLLIAVTIFEGAITPSKANRLLGLGVCIGFAVLSKYTAIFLWIGIGLYILLYQRQWLKKWQLYVSVILTGCCALPILYWNIHNDFISFAFHEERISLFSELCLSCFGQEVGGECLYNNPFVFILIYMTVFVSCFQKRSAATFYNRLFYCIGLPMILLFLVFSLFRTMLPHWNALGYTTLIFPVAVYITEKCKQGKAGLWRLAKVGGIVIVLVLILCGIQFRYNVFQLKEHDIQDPSIEISTWVKTGKAFASISTKAEKEGVMQVHAPIIATHWFPAANLDMYVAKPTNRKVLTLGGMEHVHKYAWITLSRGGFYKGMDAWYITDDYHFIDPEKIASYFETTRLVSHLHIMRNGERCKTVSVYQLKNMQKIPTNEAKLLLR
jgi:4-amino-4-deoxy-L-arabinose transferase-like glycosyltransferase